MKYLYKVFTKEEYQLGIFMCQPIKNDIDQVEDLLIYWGNPATQSEDEMTLLKPGVRISILKSAGVAIPGMFWHNLHLNGTALTVFLLDSVSFEMKAFIADGNYLLTLERKSPSFLAKRPKMAALHKAFFQFAGLGITLTDINGIIQLVNPALEKITGYTTGELVQKVTPGALRAPEIHKRKIDELIPHLENTSLTGEEAIMAYVNANETLQRENIIQRKDGELVPVLSTVTKVYDDDNSLLGYVDFITDITELKRTQNQLDIANQRLILATQAANLGIWEYNSYTKLFSLDEETYHILGIPFDTEVTLDYFFELIHPEDKPDLLQKLSNWEFDVEAIRMIRPNGEIRYIKSEAQKILNDAAAPFNIIGVMTDVTDKYLSQMALWESEKRYRFLVENLKEVVFQANLNGDWTFLNKSWTEITGFTLGDSLGINFLKFVHPDDREHSLKNFEGLVDRKKDYCRHEVRYMHIDGSYRWIEVFAKLTFDEAGQPTGTIGTLYDISDRKKMDLELSNSEKRFKAIFNSSFQFMGLLNVEGILLEVNHTALEAAGVLPEEVIGKPFWETYWWGICPKVRLKLRESIRLAAQGQKIHYEVDVWAKDQTLISIDFSITPIFDESGKVISMIPEGHDITEIKRTRAALLESEQRFRDIAENVDEIFWVRAHDEPKFLYINATYERITGKTRQSLYENPGEFLEFIMEEDRALISSFFMRTLEENTDLEFRVRTKEGQIRWFVGHIFIIRDEQGTIRRRIGIANDITAQKEKELLLTETLEKEKELNQLKSQFVSFVSHEFRTPLTTIQTSTELVEHYLFNTNKGLLTHEFAPKIKYHLSNIHHKIHFFNDLLTDTLTLNQIEAGKISFQPLPTDLTVFSETLIAEFFSDRPDQRWVELEMEGSPALVIMDPKLMSRVLVNLLSNAFKFSKANPILRLIYDHKEVKIEVIDRGIGIPSQEIPMLFTTFFRAGNVGKIAGTGLGLQISKQLVELHSGTISVHSDENIGTKMTVSLPLTTS